jgi:hypothetical protein
METVMSNEAVAASTPESAYELFLVVGAGCMAPSRKKADF